VLNGRFASLNRMATALDRQRLARLLPDTATAEGGELALGGVTVSSLARELGTPLVVYCAETLRERARAYRRSLPNGLVAYGAKAFLNVPVIRLLAGEGVGVDAWGRGELGFALRAGVPPERILLNGCDKSDEELRLAADLGLGYVVLDNLEEIPRARAAGARRTLLRLTPGIDASAVVRVGHRRSKFGFHERQAVEAVAAALEAEVGLAGFHVHIASQMLDSRDLERTVDWLGGIARSCRDTLGWSPRVVDLGGGLGIPYTDETVTAIDEFVRGLVGRLGETWRDAGLEAPQPILEPGRSLVGQAGVTLYTIGAVKEIDDETSYLIVDGGVSDNPRPQVYGARYTAFAPTRLDDEPTRTATVCGRHCEDDVLVRDAPLPELGRGDLVGLAATGAYTLSQASNYNGTPRPAAVLVADGDARLIQRRETVEDLLRCQVDP
jgi:diaminopimelate decarboxylase